jgi:hypothetical protein
LSSAKCSDASPVPNMLIKAVKNDINAPAMKQN